MVNEAVAGIFDEPMARSVFDEPRQGQGLEWPGAGRGLAAFQVPGLEVKLVMDAPQRAVPIP